VTTNPELAKRISQKIKLFNKYGKNGFKKLEKDETPIVLKLTHDGANRDKSLIFMKEMILSFLITQFREFIRELLILIFEIEFKYKGKHKSMKIPELESEAFNISEMDTKKMIDELTKKWKLKLNTQKDFKKFTEFFYRRNAYTHAKGFPDERYRKKTGYEGPNNKLDLTNEYLLNLIEVFSFFSDLINEHFLEKECHMVNINKKGNSHHIDLTKGKGKIIPVNS